MTITILPNAKTQFFNGNGVPLAKGSVFMYVPNSTTLKTSWIDPGGVTPNANPIILDGNGECLLWGSGEYRQVVYDVNSNLIWDQLTLDPGYAIMATFNGTSTTSVAIGTGTKIFTTQPGLQFFPGGTVNIASNASALNYMNGTVASYNTSTGVLVVTVLTDGGSGTYADWNIAVSGVQGPAGTVTAISVATANGLAGSSSGGGTPQLTLTTSVTGVVKGNGTALSAATAGTDYSAGTSALATGILKSTTTTGALSIAVAGDFPTLNQNTTGQAGTVVTNANLTGPITSVGNATTITNSSVTEAKLSLSNNTTANVTTSAHGFAPILPNNINLFLNGTGTYTAPVAGATIGTSTTSLTIGTGSKTYTTQSGLTIAAGQYLVIPSNANSANFMFGQVTSYTGTTLVMNITVTGGSGTFADWNILASGPQGPGGAGSINTGTTNQLAWYAANGSTLSGLATANSGLLVTSSGGVPSIATVIPNGVTATTQTAADATTKVATTAFVNQGGLTLGTSTATTQTAADSSTKVATTAFVNGTALTLASGTIAVTQSGSDSSTKVATTAQVQSAIALIPSGLTVGTTTISGGSSGSIEYNNAGVLGELATTGSGNVVRATSPTLVTPALGTPSSGNLSNCTNIPPSVPTALGIGAPILATYFTGVSVGTVGTTTAASNLQVVLLDVTGTEDSITGTWMFMQTIATSGSGGGHTGLMIRIA